MLSFNNWITYNPATTKAKDEKEVNTKKEGSNNIAKIDDHDSHHQNPIKLLPIVGK